MEYNEGKMMGYAKEAQYKLFENLSYKDFCKKSKGNIWLEIFSVIYSFHHFLL